MAPLDDPSFQLAVRHHQAGQYPQAEKIYRQILEESPDDSDALYLLGVLLGQTNSNQEAVELISRAISIDPGVFLYHSALGEFYRRLGQIDRAILSYRTAIELNPQSAEIQNDFGNLLREAGNVNEAIAACQKAVALKPNYPQALNNLGNALRDARRLDEAVASFNQAILQIPTYPEAHYNLANALLDQNQLDAAIVSFRRAIALNPKLFQAHNNLANVLRLKGLLDESIAACHAAIAINPAHAGAHNNLGIALTFQGRVDDAVAAFHAAIAINANFPQAYNNLATALRQKGQYEQAITACQTAIQLNPNFAEAYDTLGNAHKELGRLDDAIAAYRKAIELSPNLTGSHNNLANACKDQGQLDEALAHYDRVLQLSPGDARLHSNRVYTLYFHPDYTSAQILEAQKQWTSRHAQVPQFDLRNHPTTPHALNIGYISPDFRDHVIGRNILPLLREHDHANFQIFCYCDRHRCDSITEQFQQYTHAWRTVAGQTDAQVAQLIHDDQIDILVDLSLHLAGNRLPVFAMKPAPIQITFAGYPAGTGLPSIDYRITDPILDPPGLTDKDYVEQSLRIPSFWCYDPAAMMHGIPTTPEVNPLPAIKNGYITFGCLNNFCKINAKVLNLWARVLQQIPNSRLILLALEGSHRQHALDHFQSQGISPDRIEFVSYRPRELYFQYYHHIDIGLDTFPYNGHTTSLDSYWMGVPVVTLIGQTVVGRAGLSQLTNLGLPELAAHSPESYIDIATKLSNDLPRLTQLRSTLRNRMLNSPLTNATQFARNIESAYRQVWQSWLTQQSNA